MGKLTAEDAVNAIQSSRCTAEFVPVPGCSRLGPLPPARRCKGLGETQLRGGEHVSRA